MTTTPHPTEADQRSHSQRRYRARVSIRVPRDGGADLSTNARRRLERPVGVETVENVEIAGLEPSLAATNVRIGFEVETACEMARNDVEALLESAPGVERVRSIREVDADCTRPRR